MKRQTRTLLIAGGAGIALTALVVSISLGASLSTSSRPDAATTSLPTPSSSATPAPEPSSTAAADPAEPTTPAAPTIDPYYGDVVVAPSVDGSAEMATGLSVGLISVTKTSITGSGVGSTSGPAITVSIRVTNSTAGTITLTPVVNAYEGQDRTPLTPDHETPLPASLAAGAQGEGSYVFAADDTKSTIWITVSTAPDSGLVLFEHTR